MDVQHCQFDFINGSIVAEIALSLMWIL
ncbi:DUF645 family protein [Vibrio cholerae]|nr:DUF645 family protein [Vibrio cholerae]MDW4535883.1 DUF645 family protein [Vibrio cholerae]